VVSIHTPGKKSFGLCVVQIKFRRRRISFCEVFQLKTSRHIQTFIILNFRSKFSSDKGYSFNLNPAPPMIAESLEDKIKLDKLKAKKAR